MTTSCNACGLVAQPFAQAILLDKHQVQYFRCEACGFVQTETPFWLDEAYERVITSSDIGLVSRNVQTSVITRAVIRALFDSQGRFLDYGGGWGILVRLMRDSGYDFCRFDQYAENLFAQGFDLTEEDDGSFELLTAYEVFEHLVDPREEIAQMLTLSKSILFSTRLIGTPPPMPNEWWYYGREHGQHVSLFSRQSLEAIAREHQLNFVTNGSSIHLFTPKRISSRLFNLITRYRLGQVWDIVSPRRSLRAQDYHALTRLKLDS